MLFDQFFQLGDVFFGFDRIQIDQSKVAVQAKLLFVFGKNVRNSTRHAGCEVATGLAEHDDSTAGHVFQTVVADAFDDGSCSRVADAESFGGHSAEEGFTFGRSIKSNVADDDVVFRFER